MSATASSAAIWVPKKTVPRLISETRTPERPSSRSRTVCLRSGRWTGRVGGRLNDPPAVDRAGPGLQPSRPATPGARDADPTALADASRLDGGGLRRRDLAGHSGAGAGGGLRATGRAVRIRRRVGDDLVDL